MRLFAISLAGLVTLFLGMASKTSPSQTNPVSFAAPDSADVARLVEGAELFSRTCQRCHSPRSPAERTDREWVIIMQHMQTRANLTYRQTALVREFLLASNDTDIVPGRVRSDLETATSVTEEMIEQGRLVYEGAGACFACHGAALQGGPIAPNLNDDNWKSGSGDFKSILNTVRNGVPGTAMAAYPGGISDEQAQHVAAYIASVAEEQKGE